MNLSAKVLLAFFATYLIILVFSSIVGYRINTFQFEKNTELNQELAAEEAIASVDIFLFERYGDIQAFSKTETVIEYLQTKNIDLEQRIKKRFEGLQSIYGSWEELSVIDTSGRVVISTSSDKQETSLLSKNDTYTDLFQKSLDGKVVYSDFFYSGRLNDYTLVFMSPVRNDSNQVIGVLEGHVNWPVIIENLRISHIKDFHLLNKDGYEIASAEKRAVLEHNLSSELYFKETKQGKSFSIKRNGIGESKEYLISAVPESGYLGFKGNNWILVFESPLEEIFAQARLASVAAPIVTIPIGIIGLVIFMVFLNKVIIKRITKINSVANSVAQGTLEVSVEDSGSDEISQLSKSFNQMIMRLKNYNNKLQEEVKYKTKDIESNLIEIESKNKFAEETKKAMMNLLDDAKRLEEQLEVEKAGVEKKVTERTQELYEEKIKLQSSISSLTVGFIMTDKNNNIAVINQAARNMLCSSSGSDLATVKECTLTHIEDELKGSIDLRSLINSSINEKKTILIKELGFENRFLKIFITPIMKGDEAMGSVILIDNITEAKILDRSRDEFFSIASHELRTPLTAIRGNTSLIKQYYWDKLGDKDLQIMIGDIHDSSIRLIQIVNDFLNLSRLEQGKMEFKLENFDIAELIDKKVKEVDAISKEKGIVVNFDKDSLGIFNVYADKNRLSEVILNLLGNAIKYTDKGTVTITVLKQGEFAKVSVTDTGKGIAEAQTSLLFRKFQQAGDNILTRESSQSTGLGLYISKLMIEAMHGEIFLESSKIDEGSVFSFTIPVAKQA